MAGISFSVTVGGLKELIGRLLGFGLTEKHRMFAQAMKESLEVLHNAVPRYPPPPAGSKYMRTERLGKSMGSGFGGGKVGMPDVYEMKVTGNSVEGKFGSRLGYAEYVIGDGQAEHMGHWWTVRDLLQNVAEEITGIWNALGERIAAYINGK